jgi:hypothetical protein
MITTEIREELRRIQLELRKPFPANKHEVRDLPGGGRKWVFLPWQIVRERLDEVCPEWIIDYSEIQYLGNDAICRAGITILGIRKEAIASVPISLTSSSGKEMTRGSAADRLAAEATKNAAEQWCVGRYLDDQEFTIRYLWEHRHELDDQMMGEVRRLAEQYKVDKGIRTPQPRTEKEGSLLHDIAGTSTVLTITEGQRKRLWAVGKNEYKLSDAQIKSAYKHFGFDKPEAIAANKYDDVMSYMKALSQQQPQSPPPVNPSNNAIIKTLLTTLAFDQGRFDSWLARVYPGMTAELLSNSDIERIIRAICKSYAEERKNDVAAQVIDNVVVGQYKIGIAIADALNDWKDRYFQSVGVR